MTSTSRELRKRWVDAVNRLSEDPLAEVPCPNCGHAFLVVMKLASLGGSSEKQISCESCGANTFVRSTGQDQSEQ